MSVDTLWVAVDENDGQARGGPFDSRAECIEWIEWEDGLEPRELRREVALAQLAETRQRANDRHDTWLLGPDGPVGRFMVEQFGALPYEVRKTAWEAAKAVVAQHYTEGDEQ